MHAALEQNEKYVLAYLALRMLHSRLNSAVNVNILDALLGAMIYSLGGPDICFPI